MSFWPFFRVKILNILKISLMYSLSSLKHIFSKPNPTTLFSIDPPRNGAGSTQIHELYIFFKKTNTKHFFYMIVLAEGYIKTQFFSACGGQQIIAFSGFSDFQNGQKNIKYSENTLIYILSFFTFFWEKILNILKTH